MPRQRGIGMRKPKKKAVEPLGNAEETPLPPPAAPEPEPPPSPDPKLTIRARPQQSPGMKAVKAATYAARKADRVARAARLQFLRESLAFVQCHVDLTNRGDRLGKDWKKKGSPKRSYHLEKLNNILLGIEAKRVHLLQTQVVASELAVDAKDAAIAERDARLHRLSRLLRRKHGKVPRTL